MDLHIRLNVTASFSVTLAVDENDRLVPQENPAADRLLEAVAENVMDTITADGSIRDFIFAWSEVLAQGQALRAVNERRAREDAWFPARGFS